MRAGEWEVVEEKPTPQGDWEVVEEKPGGGGLLEPGNIDLTNRPVVKNSDGSFSTIRSMSVNLDGQEVLIPTVADNGTVLSDDQAIDLYRRTGRHLGKFSSAKAATEYAESLHRQQERRYFPSSLEESFQALKAVDLPPDEAATPGLAPDLPDLGSLPVAEVPDFQALAESNPATSRFLADPRNMAAARDDVRELASVEDWTDQFLSGFRAMGWGPLKATQSFWELLDNSAAILERATGVPRGGAFKRLAGMAEPPKSWKPRNWGAKTMALVARTPIDIGKLLTLQKFIPGGNIANAMALEGAINAGAQGGLEDAAMGAAHGYMFGQVLHGTGMLPKLAQSPTAAAIGGGLTYLETGDPEEAVATGLLFAGFHAPQFLQGLGERIQGAKLSKRAPILMGELMGHLVEAGKLPERLYFKPERMEELFQDAKARDTFLEKIGVDAEEYAEALATGRQVGFQAGKMAYFALDPKAKGMLAELEYSPFMEEVRLSAKEEGRDLSETERAEAESWLAQQAGDWPHERFEEIRGRFEAAGLSEKEAAANTALIEARARTWADQTGGRPSDYLDRYGFEVEARKEGDLREGELGQPLDPRVDPDTEVPFVDLSAETPTNITGQGFKDYLAQWEGVELLVDTKIQAEGVWLAETAKGNLKRKKHPFWSAEKAGRHDTARRKALTALDKVLGGAALVETLPAKHGETSRTFRFYVPVLDNGRPTLLRVVAHQMKGKKASIDGVEIYDIIKEKPAPRTTPQGRGKAGPAGLSKIKIRHMLAGVKDAAGNPYVPGRNIFFQLAFHGSPHRFDKFSTAHTGSGEGVQAFGWGIYLAGKKEVAEFYRVSVSAQKIEDSANVYLIEAQKGHGDVSRLSPENRKRALDIFERTQRERNLYSQSQAERIRRQIAEEGQLYKVEIPDDTELLDWGKPISEQPKGIREKILREIGIEPGTQRYMDDLFLASPTKDGGYVYKAPGRIFYNYLASKLGAKGASERLASIGIPGHRYLDGMSRGAGKGSYNYVIYMDAAVSIKETYYQGRRGAVRFTEDNKALIAFFESRDMSTAPHEIFHVFRRDLEDLATAEDAPAQVKADWERACAFVGVEPGEKWTTAQEEMWAKAAERYLGEGKAPVPELQGVFSRLSKWIVSVYKSLRNIGADITPEMRGVFDRLLATEEEIAWGREVTAMERLFHADDLARMETERLLTREDVAAYEKKVVAAQEAFRARVEKQRLVEERRKEREWRKEARQEADAHPDLALVEDLVAAGGLDYDFLARDYDSAFLAELNRRRPGIIRKGGVNPDMIASERGFDDYTTMVEKIVNLPTKKQYIQDYVDSRRAEAERHWAADEAAISEEYGAMLEAEVEFLGRSLKYKPRPNLTLRRIIEEQTGQKKVSNLVSEDLALKASLRAQDRIARRVAKDVRKEEKAQARERIREVRAQKDMQRLQALERKRVAVLQLRERIKAREEIQKAVRYFKRAKRAGIHPDYLDQIHALLSQYDLATRSQKTLEDRARLREFVEKARENGEEVTVPDKVMNQAFQTSMSEITLDGLRELRAAVENLEHLGRLTNALIAGEKMREFEGVMGEVLGRIRDVWGTPPTETEPMPPSARRKTKIQRLNEIARGFMADLKKVEFICRALDGYQDMGPAWREVFQPLKAAEDIELQMGEKVTARLSGIFEPFKNRMKEIRTKKRKIEGVPGVWTTEELLMVALNSGNEGNYKAMVEGEWNADGLRLTEDHIRRLKDALTAEEWAFVRGVWETVNSMFNPLAETYRAMTGGRLKKVAGWEVETPHGKIMGDYFPLVFDRELSTRADRLASDAEIKDMFTASSSYSKAKTADGMTVERKGGRMAPLLAFEVIFRHVQDTLHYTTHARAIRDVQKITMDPRFRRTVEQALGKDTWRQFGPWLKHIAKPVLPVQTTAERILRKLRHNTTINALGLSMSVFLAQPMSLTQTVNEVGAMRVARALGEFLATPGGARRIIEEVNAKSPQMRARRKRWDRDLEEMYGRFRPKFMIDNAKAKDAFFWLIGIGDYIGAYPSWIAAYRKGMDVHGLESRAVEYADFVVRTTQPTAAPKDLARVQRSSELMKMATMFYSFFSVYQNRLMEMWPRYMKGKPDAAGLAKAFFWTVIAPAMLMDNVKRWLKEHRFSTAKENLQAVNGYAFAGIPVVRDVVSPIITGFDYSFSPATSGLESLVRTGVMVAKTGQALAEGEDAGETAKKAGKSAVETIGYLKGWPTRQGLVTFEGLVDILSGETRDPTRLFVREPRKRKKK